jgi:hypothetical protein
MKYLFPTPKTTVRHINNDEPQSETFVSAELIESTELIAPYSGGVSLVSNVPAKDDSDLLSDNASDDHFESGEKKNHYSITRMEAVDEKEKLSKNIGNDANNESLSESPKGNHDSAKLWERIRDENKRQQDQRESLHEHQRKSNSQSDNLT